MINFRRAGSGNTTLVFLHGWGGSWQSWAPIINKLTVQGSPFTIYALDLPGFGLSELSRAYGLVDYVEELREFFEKEGIKKPVLIGHSFGGQVAAKFAIDKGKLLKGLILVDPAGVRDNRQLVRADTALASLGRKLIETSPVAFLYPQLRRWYYQFRGFGESDYFRIENENVRKMASTIFREDLTGELDKIEIPTLIMWGEKDRATPLEQAKIYKDRIEDSKLVVVPGAGHFSYLDDQDGFVKEINGFVNKLK